MALPTLQEFAAMDADERHDYLHHYASWARQLSHIAEDECRTKQEVIDAGVSDEGVQAGITEYNKQRFLEIWNNEPTVEE